MNAERIEEIADAVLYEGYILYPYRASAVKNRQRWNFGVLYPQAFAETQRGADRWNMQTECLAQTTETDARLSVRVRFLHLIERRVESQTSQTWQEAVEREVEISFNVAEIAAAPIRRSFAFPAGTMLQKSVEGAIDIEGEDLGNGLLKIRIRVFNTGSLEETGAGREDALMRSLVSAHTIVRLSGGEFISLLDPPNELRAIASGCQNLGTWPVLVGEEGTRDAMLSSPIILYDYPQIAPESAGALFDGTEIDEILTLRIMTLTDQEKLEVGQGDERARQILQRTECMPPEQLMKMHGAMRGLRRADQETP